MSIDAHIEDLTNSIVSCGNLLVREAGRLFRAQGITPAQFNVLNLLRIAEEGLRPSEIAAKLVVDPASTTYLLKQVEERGWITRVPDEQDRRAYRVEFTREGREKVEDVLPLYQAGLAEMARLLGERPHAREALELLAELPVVAVAATSKLTNQSPGASTRQPVKAKAKVKAKVKA